MKTRGPKRKASAELSEKAPEEIPKKLRSSPTPKTRRRRPRPRGVENKKKKTSQKNQQEETSPPSPPFSLPVDVFRKILELSPDRKVHNAVGRTNKELYSLVQSLAAEDDHGRWPGATILDPPNADNTATRRRRSFCSWGSFASNSKEFILSENNDGYGSLQMKLFDIQKGLIQHETIAVRYHQQDDATTPTALYSSPDWRYVICMLRNGVITIQDEQHQTSRPDDEREKNWTPSSTLGLGLTPMLTFVQDRITGQSRYMAVAESSHLVVLDLLSRKVLVNVRDQRFSGHGRTVPFHCNGRFLLWQRNDQSIGILNFLAPDIGLNLAAAFSVVSDPPTGQRKIDSFLPHPVDESLVVAVQTRSEGTIICHDFSLLQFSCSLFRPVVPADDDDDNNNNNNNEQDGVFSMDKITVKCRGRIETDEKIDLLVERREIPKHKTRMFWFADGMHVGYHYDRTIHLLKVQHDDNADAEDIDMNIHVVDNDTVDPKCCLPAQLVAKANAFIEEKLSPMMYIDWVQLAPNQRTLAMRVALLPGQEMTCMVSI
jgi:hypothetical protein